MQLGGGVRGADLGTHPLAPVSEFLASGVLPKAQHSRQLLTAQLPQHLLFNSSGRRCSRHSPTKILAASAISPHSQETQGSKFDVLKEGLRTQEESWVELPVNSSLWRAGGPRAVALSPCILGPGPYGQSERRYSLLWHPTLAEERHMTGAVQPDRVAQRPEGPRTETLTKAPRQPNRNWTHP